jgi:hypothetical protein
MSELARRRRARDLWISRSHLRAAVALGLTLSAASSLVGFRVGRDRGPAPGPPREASDEALIDLLARIEANARPEAAVEELTFPDALRSSIESAPAPGGDPPDATAVQLPFDGAWSVVVTGGTDEPAARALEQGLRQAGLAPRLRGGGADGWVVTVGAWPSADAAAVGLAVVRAAGYDGKVEAVPGR